MSVQIEKKATREDFGKVFIACREIYHAPALTQIETLHEFVRATGCTSYDHLVAAFRNWMARGEKFPTPHDIRLELVLL